MTLAYIPTTTTNSCICSRFSHWMSYKLADLQYFIQYRPVKCLKDHYSYLRLGIRAGSEHVSKADLGSTP